MTNVFSMDPGDHFRRLMESRLAGRYCHMFSTGFGSGDFDGSRIIVMFPGL